MGRRIEWPPGSGNFAEYLDSEVATIDRLRQLLDSSRAVTQNVYVEVVELIHRLKCEQPTLSNPDANTIGKFHADAKLTERKAALAIYPKTGTQRRSILERIALNTGATDEELSYLLNMNPSSVRPRRGELVEGGWIEDSGRTRQLRSGEKGIVWVLTEKGRAERGQQ